MDFDMGNTPVNESKDELNHKSKDKDESNHKSKDKSKKKYKKKPIPKALKIAVWKTYTGDAHKEKCFCCNITEIGIENNECGHIMAESNEGETKLYNLRPICGTCNKSMGNKNMIEFIKDNGFTMHPKFDIKAFEAGLTQITKVTIKLDKQEKPEENWILIKEETKKEDKKETEEKKEKKDKKDKKENPVMKDNDGIDLMSLRKDDIKRMFEFYKIDISLFESQTKESLCKTFLLLEKTRRIYISDVNKEKGDVILDLNGHNLMRLKKDELRKLSRKHKIKGVKSDDKKKDICLKLYEAKVTMD